MNKTNPIKLELNGVSYVQKGEEIMAKIERGEIPPPSKDRRRKLKLGAYTALVSEMLKRNFTVTAVHRVLETHGIKVKYLTVLKFCKIVRNRKPPVPRLTVGINSSLSTSRTTNPIPECYKQTIRVLSKVIRNPAHLAQAAIKMGVPRPYKQVYNFSYNCLYPHA